MQRKQLHHFVVVVTAASLERFGPESWQDRWKGQMLLHHVEANSLVHAGLTPRNQSGARKIAHGALCMREREVVQGHQSRVLEQGADSIPGLWTTSILPCHYGGLRLGCLI